jgi:hypothetical protein
MIPAPELATTTPAPGLHGEELLAVLGIRGFLAREHRRVTQMDLRAAARLPDAISTELRRFYSGEPLGRGERARGEPFDYLKVIRQLAQPVLAPDLEAMVGAHQQGGDALDMLVPLTRVLGYLNGAAPRRARQGLFTAEPLRPSDQEVGRFQRLYQALHEPLSILRRLRAGTVLADETAAVAACYPDLFAVIQERAARVFAELLVRRPGHRLGYRREALLRTVLQAGPADASLISEMQAAFGPPGSEEQQPAPAHGGRGPVKAGSYATGAQGAESGGRSGGR